MTTPYKVFTIYAREDAQYLEELRGQLRPLEIAGRIKVWSDREINPGVDWEQEIVHNPNTSTENSVVQKRKSGLEMVEVEGGTFMMGSPKSETHRQIDECQHSVSVKYFEIGKYEVTQADWVEIMGNNPSDHKDCDDCPVESVSWDEVQIPCSEMVCPSAFPVSKRPFYSGDQARQPRDEVARAGSGCKKGGNNYGIH
jgi:Sulfatase-modifying factor enzyme 1